MSPRKCRRCPIPRCAVAMAAHTFFCKKHEKMLPPVIGAAVKKSLQEWQRLTPGTPQRALVAQTLKQALAFGYASICEQLGLPVPGVVVSDAGSTLTAAVAKALH